MLTRTQESFVFAGFGGQGIMFAGQLLAHTAMEEGYNVTWIPSYGPEMRGGTANCFVVISSKPIGSPLVTKPNVAVVFNIPSFQKFEPMIAPGGLLATNGSLITQRSQREDIDELIVPATDIASELGALQMANMVMLGAVLAFQPILRVQAIRTALENHLPARHKDMLPQNFAALDKGGSYVTKHYSTIVPTVKA